MIEIVVWRTMEENSNVNVVDSADAPSSSSSLSDDDVPRRRTLQVVNNNDDSMMTTGRKARVRPALYDA